MFPFGCNDALLLSPPFFLYFSFVLLEAFVIFVFDAHVYMRLVLVHQYIWTSRKRKIMMEKREKKHHSWAGAKQYSNKKRNTEKKGKMPSLPFKKNLLSYNLSQCMYSCSCIYLLYKCRSFSFFLSVHSDAFFLVVVGFQFGLFPILRVSGLTPTFYYYFGVVIQIIAHFFLRFSTL